MSNWSLEPEETHAMANNRLMTLVGLGILVLLVPIAWSHYNSLSHQGLIDAQVENYRAVGLQAAAGGQHARSVAALRLAYALAPARAEIKRELILAQAKRTAMRPDLLSSNQAEQLAMEMEIAGVSEDEGPVIGVALGQLDIIQGRLSEAHARFERLATRYETSAVVQFALGKSRVMRGDEAGAVKAFASAAKLDDSRHQYQAALGSLLSKVGKLNLAEDALAKAVQLRQTTSVLLTLARVRIRLEKYDRAVKTLEAGVRSGRDHSEVAQMRGLMGFALHRLGRYDEAVSELRGSYKVLKDPTVLHNLGVVYQSIGEHGKAARIFKTTLADDPGNADGHQRLVRALMATGKRDEARIHVDHLRRIAAVKPELMETLKATQRFVREPENPPSP
jgi:tetratricopeptide (TPR) repeat protein